MIDPDLVARTIAGPLGAAILANQLDELFVDLAYLARGRRHARRISPEALRAGPARRIAVMLPAWREEAVIERMLAHNLSVLDYPADRYLFFCGTYRNDPGTQERVDAVARRGLPVRKVVVPHDGPTSKADCLNWIYQGIVLEERRRGRRFDVLLLHDAEDVIHPLAFRLYSHLVPPLEFVQTPVFSLPLHATKVVAGTYVDEFSEHHLKELPVRDALGGLVPSAGVGSAFDRRAFEEIAAAFDQKPFNPESLTEDYEIGLKFRLAGKRVRFACYEVDRGANPFVPRAPEYVATREYFPDGFRASVRQRGRWILGIALQTWAQLGWRGPPAVRWCLWRDRKAIVTNALLALAYALTLYVVLRAGAAAIAGSAWTPARVAAPGSLVHLLLLLNLCGFLLRVGVKMHFVRRLYGPAQAALVMPRLLVANVISLAATARALALWTRHLVTRAPLRWVKTAHAFPSPEALAGEVPAERPAPRLRAVEEER